MIWVVFGLVVFEQEEWLGRILLVRFVCTLKYTDLSDYSVCGTINYTDSSEYTDLWFAIPQNTLDVTGYRKWGIHSKGAHTRVPNIVKVLCTVSKLQQ